MSDPLGQLRLHFTGLSLQEEVPHGQVYTGTDALGTRVTIAVLAPHLANQPNLRNAFADVVWRHSVGSEPGRVTVYAADLHAAMPWAAIRNGAGEPGAEQLLKALADTSPTAAMPTPPTAWTPPPPPPSPGLAPVTPTPTPSFQPQSFPPGGQPPFGQQPLASPTGQTRGPWPWVIGATGALAAIGLVVVATLVGVRVLGGDDDPDPPITLPTTGQPTAPPPTESPTTPPTESPDSGEEPELRNVELVSVVGPNWEPGEETWTMAFRGWPFAFRAPGTWDCIRGDPVALFPGAELWGCQDLRSSEPQRATVMLWECDGACDEAEQQEKLDTWLDQPDDAVQWQDSPTYYVETEENEDGLYSVDLGHFTAVGADELRWMVGVYIQSPPDTREDVQKMLNDIISQTV
ncbi:MAG TPA: hypothetical protein VIL37_09060 [Natronosporangium sp.]